MLASLSGVQTHCSSFRPIERSERSEMLLPANFAPSASLGAQNHVTFGLNGTLGLCIIMVEGTQRRSLYSLWRRVRHPADPALRVPQIVWNFAHSKSRFSKDVDMTSPCPTKGGCIDEPRRRPSEMASNYEGAGAGALLLYACVNIGGAA